MQSDEINELASALSKAQSALEGAEKDAENKYYKSSYADLTSIWDACREALTSNNLAVIQTTQIFDEELSLVTTLCHSSGQWVKSFYPVRPIKDDPQGLGSALTYARRYSLASIAGVAPKGDDDDGEASVDHIKAPAPKKKPVMTGDMGLAELRKADHGLQSDIRACTDIDMFNILKDSKDTKAIIAQIRKDMPTLWNGNGGDIKGLSFALDQREQELKNPKPQVTYTDGTMRTCEDRAEYVMRLAEACKEDPNMWKVNLFMTTEIYDALPALHSDISKIKARVAEALEQLEITDAG